MSTTPDANASSTPLKRYSLPCPVCRESEVALPAETPDAPFCRGCDEAVDLDRLAELIDGWTEYLRDRKALLDSEEGRQ